MNSKEKACTLKKKQKKSLKVGREGHFTSLLLADNSICSREYFDGLTLSRDDQMEF